MSDLKKTIDEIARRGAFRRKGRRPKRFERKSRKRRIAVNPLGEFLTEINRNG